MRKQVIAEQKGRFEARYRRICKDRLIATHGQRCMKCRRSKRKSELTIDHIKPLSKGGEDAPRNYQLLCRECNQEKAATEVDYRGGRS